MSNALRVICVAALFVALSPFALAQNRAADTFERQSNDVEVQTYDVDRGGIVGDGSFETGSPNASWGESSTNFGTPLCTIAFCGMGGGTGPNTGDWWAWFGGINAVETGTVSQSVTIPNGTATLSFFLEIPVGDNAGFLDVSLDGNVVFSATEADTTTYGTYTQVTVNIDAFADGGAHALLFNSTVQPGAGVTNFFVDDVDITAGGGPNFVVDANPEAQSVPQGGVASFTVNVTNNTANPASGQLCYKAGPLAPVLIVSGTVPAGGMSPNIPVSINVPGAAPTGTYTVNFRAGPNCNTVIASDDVLVTVTAGGSAPIDPMSEWTLAAPVEWPTFETAARTSEVGAFPNPFTERTEIAFSLENASDVSLVVYDVRGRAVATLTDGTMEAGQHSVTFDGASLPSGVYVYRLMSGTQVETGRITLVK